MANVYNGAPCNFLLTNCSVKGTTFTFTILLSLFCFLLQEIQIVNDMVEAMTTARLTFNRKIFSLAVFKVSSEIFSDSFLDVDASSF